MAITGNEQMAIVELMAGKYAHILPIEAEWGIRLREGDMRPRIEHFHDAVRALTSGEASIYEKHSRLSVEHLAYDLGQLRMIQGKPLGIINRATEKSTSSALVRQGEAGAGIPKLPPQAVRGQLTTLYKDYMVFFAALFAEIANINFQSRSDGIDSMVEDIARIEEVIQQLIAGKMTNAQAMQEMLHVERDDLRERLQKMLASKSLSAREKQEALALLGKVDKGLAAEKKALEQSHLHYATGQLAVYEDAKETVKKLAQQGLNLAGRFVDNAMRSAQQGRGQGQGR